MFCQPFRHSYIYLLALRYQTFHTCICIVDCHLVLSQLYGEADPDQDVSPDTEDPEATGNK